MQDIAYKKENEQIIFYLPHFVQSEGYYVEFEQMLLMDTEDNV